MHLDYTPSQRALRDELRAYLAGLITPELVAELDENEGGGPLYHKAVQQLGADNWLGIGWPKEHGGQERGPIEQFIFFDEVQRAGFPVPILTLNTVGPTLLKFGTPAQIAEYAPRILAGKCHFSIGYTEPDSGTDLASLKTTATRDGDEWVINGQKIWTSLADHADYIWLAARTNPDPNAPPHKAISMFIVPTTAKGFSYTPIHALGENNVHATYYDNVRVPAGNLVSNEGGGWKLITTQLNHERVGLGPAGRVAGIYEQVHSWASEPGSNGVVPLDDPEARRLLGQIKSIWRLNELLNWQVAASGENIAVADAAATKVFSTERIQEVGRLAEEVVGRFGNPADAHTAHLLDWLDKMTKRNLVITFGGGVNEVMREMIAASGLKVPRVPR